MLLTAGFSLSAQVTRTPQVFYTPVFTEDPVFMGGSLGWMSLRHVLNQEAVPDFGHDWESGVNISLFSSKNTVIAGLVEETFHFSAAPETQSSWFFNPASIISDLRLLVYQRLNPVILKAGFQHDCKHDVDSNSIRMQIHDILFASIMPADDIEIFRSENLLLNTNLAVEGAVNLPAGFQGAPPQPDIGRLGGFLRIQGFYPAEPMVGITADASAAITWRSEDTTVEGLEPVGLDYNLRAGLTAASENGIAALYIGTERLTDSWTDFSELPVFINYISLELTSGAN